MAEISSNFVKHPTGRPSLVSPLGGPEQGLEIPVIDLGGLAGDSADRQATMQAMTDACNERGFFQVVNHGVSLDLAAERMRRRLWKEFFLLPMEDEKAHATSPRTYEDYGSRLGIEKDAILDRSDYFNFLPDSLGEEKWHSIKHL